MPKKDVRSRLVANKAKKKISKAKKKVSKLPGRLLIHPCIGHLGHYRPFLFQMKTSVSSVRPNHNYPSLWILEHDRTKLSYYWDIMVNNHPESRASLSGYRLVSNWNYLTQDKCEKVARRIAKAHGIEIVEVVRAEKWSAKIIKEDLSRFEHEGELSKLD